VPHEPEDAWKQWQEGKHWTRKLAGWACDEARFAQEVLVLANLL